MTIITNKEKVNLILVLYLNGFINCEEFKILTTKDEEQEEEQFKTEVVEESYKEHMENLIKAKEEARQRDKEWEKVMLHFTYKPVSFSELMIEMKKQADEYYKNFINHQ